MVSPEEYAKTQGTRPHSGKEKEEERILGRVALSTYILKAISTMARICGEKESTKNENKIIKHRRRKLPEQADCFVHLYIFIVTCKDGILGYLKWRKGCYWCQQI